jgi:hypothetical protein
VSLASNAGSTLTHSLTATTRRDRTSRETSTAAHDIALESFT